MVFRTPVDIKPDHAHTISHRDNIVMLGSCFTDNVGSLLESEGFNVTHNPLGPLYNPASILRCIELAREAYLHNNIDSATLLQDDSGVWHCLDFASRYAHHDAKALNEMLLSLLRNLGEAIINATTIIITLGTARVYDLASTGMTVGNCHKFTPQTFNRRLLTLDETTELIRNIIQCASDNRPNIIFTISPIRHLGDGLHGNQISKATLQLALENAITDSCSAYFPAYEIMMDDLRDYRFYGYDMKHPSDIAVEYIYEAFKTCYFNRDTCERAARAKKEFLKASHRPINPHHNQ